MLCVLIVFFLMYLRTPRSTRTNTLFPDTTLFRSREGRSLDEPFRPTHPNFGVRMSDHLEGGIEKKQRDNSGDDEIRPGAARPDYQKCCDDHREVGDRIVAAEQPDRAHVGVSFAETREEIGRAHV